MPTTAFVRAFQQSSQTFWSDLRATIFYAHNGKSPDLNLAVATEPVDDSNPFLFHKTTLHVAPFRHCASTGSGCGMPSGLGAVTRPGRVFMNMPGV